MQSLNEILNSIKIFKSTEYISQIKKNYNLIFDLECKDKFNFDEIKLTQTIQMYKNKNIITIIDNNNGRNNKVEFITGEDCCPMHESIMIYKYVNTLKNMSFYD